MYSLTVSLMLLSKPMLFLALAHFSEIMTATVRQRLRAESMVLV